MKTFLLVLLTLTACQSPNTALDEHAHTLPHGHDMMAHGVREVEGAVPAVDLIVHKDAAAGWNLEISTQQFVWAPEEASGAHVEGHGHGHLYIDGVKVTRIYGVWYHIPALTPGTHEIKVTLNSNSHEDYAVDGVRIEDVEYVTVN